jgi:ATP-dependent 26S proteasome regulatory subunit
MNQLDASALLDRYLRSRQPLVAIVSYEEARVMRAIREVAANRAMSVVTWSFTSGIEGASGVASPATTDPAAAFREILKFAGSHPKTLFVMRDLHGFLGNASKGHSPVLVRFLRDVTSAFESAVCSMILLSPTLDIPDDLKKGLASIDWPLPDSTELAAVLATAEAEVKLPVKLNGDRGLVIEAMKGLTEFEARSVLASAMVACRELSAAVIPLIVREKAQIIKRGGLLEFYDRTVTMADIGGLEGLKKYAARKRAAMTLKAREAGVDAPKGCVLVGPPGTGKSKAAKAIAGGTMPLVRMDVGALMGGLVGQSESNTRRALAQVEAVAPCVCWLDEIEKGLGGMRGGENDGGTRMRVFGTILTWMQERQAEVYVVATANDIQALDAALIRRFDDVLFVDLPSKAERVEIASIHLAQRHQDPAAFDLVAIADATWSFSGAEIEKTIAAALEDAFVSGQALTTASLLEAAGQMKPVSSTMPEQVDAIRAWVNASGCLRANAGLEPAPVHDGSDAGRSIDLQ